MGKSIQTLFGPVLTLLLAACGTTSGGDGNNGGDPGGTPVTVRRMDSWPLEGSYFRTGNGSWRNLSFNDGQATFTASNDYEVAVRCKDTGSYPYVPQAALLFFKATASQTPSLSFSCNARRVDEILPPIAPRTFEVSLPASIGGQAIQTGDEVRISSLFSTVDRKGQYSGGPVTLSGIDLSDGEQEVLFVVVRPVRGSPSAPGTLIGYKLARLNLVGSGPFSVDATGWKPFAAIATGERVFFFRQGMKKAFKVNEGNRYGVLSEPGKYLGRRDFEYSREYESRRAWKEIGGKDWSPSPMDPWPSQGIKLEDGTLTLYHPQARTYFLAAPSLFRDARIPHTLDAQIIVHASGPIRYTLPTPPGVVLEDFSRRYGALDVFALQGDLRGILLGWWIYELSEDFLNGLDTTYVRYYMEFRGRTHVLP